MKNKIFLTMLMLLSLSNFSNMSATTKPEQLKDEQKFFLQVKAKTKKAVELLKACSSKTINGSKQALVAFKDLFKFIVDKADKLTSKKVFIATMMTVGPAIALYCKYFNPEPLQNLLAKFFSSTTEGAVKVGTPIAQGIVEGASKSIQENKEIVREISLIAANNGAAISSEVAAGLAEGTVSGFLNNKAAVLKAAGIYVGLKSLAKIGEKTIENFGEKFGPIIVNKTAEGLQLVTPLITYCFTFGKLKTGYLARP